ncbi:hypothetical protein BOSEA1005_11354 [Hyphomicrobiales bacterium]|nr:hypothetical protein BOSEA1005_11354 [Hyphomicrobiales bacterium]
MEKLTFSRPENSRELGGPAAHRVQDPAAHLSDGASFHQDANDRLMVPAYRMSAAHLVRKPTRVALARVFVASPSVRSCTASQNSRNLFAQEIVHG